jgi:hypothetical protein
VRAPSSAVMPEPCCSTRSYRLFLEQLAAVHPVRKFTLVGLLKIRIRHRRNLSFDPMPKHFPFTSLQTVSPTLGVELREFVGNFGDHVTVRSVTIQSTTVQSHVRVVYKILVSSFPP